MKKHQGSIAETASSGRRAGEGKGGALVALLQRSGEGALVVDASGRIVAANPAASRITGYEPDELEAMNASALEVPSAPERGLVALLRSAAEAGAERGECLLCMKSGELCAVEVDASPVDEAGGAIICLLRDVTLRTRQQAALEESQAQLRKTNARLESALAQTRVFAQEAEAANRAKSAFLASMSHELRTPLNVINGLAATMAEQSRDSTEVHSAQLILESGQSLLSIIEELLDFSGLQAGKVRLEPRPFDLLGLLTLVVRQVAVLARRKGLAFSYRVRGGVPSRIVGDPRRIQQVLLNLLGNAVNYTSRGGVVLDVLGFERDGRWRLVFTVLDSGVGIAPADLPKLFQPFSRAEFGTVRQVHGTGLGLVIARSFTQLMGGDLSVRSLPGRGTVFRCAIEVDETDGVSALRALKPTQVKRERVLVVCSEQPTRRMIVDAIRQWGLVPIVWHGPEKPLDRAEIEAGADLVIVEAALARNLSGMLNRFLQARSAGAVVPVLWLTSPDRKWPVPAAARAANVAMPLDLAELARSIAGLFTPAGSAAEISAANLKLGERLPLRILVADDIPTNREMMRRLLQHLGYAAHLVVNGAEAVEAQKLQFFDLILLDVEMPVMNGLAAAREIVRQQPDAARRPKLVALTANAQSGDRERCLASGMDDYLSKPVLPSHLEACFLKLFRSESPVEVAPMPAADEPDLVDRAQLALMFPGLPAAQVAEILHQMQVSANRDLDSAWPRLGEACANRNCAHLAETAHGLKGCFTMLGWSRLAAYCNEAIGEARAGTFTGWTSFGPGLQRLHDLSVAEMGCYLEELVEMGGAPLAGPGNGR